MITEDIKQVMSATHDELEHNSKSTVKRRIEDLKAELKLKREEEL